MHERSKILRVRQLDTSASNRSIKLVDNHNNYLINLLLPVPFYQWFITKWATCFISCPDVTFRAMDVPLWATDITIDVGLLKLQTSINVYRLPAKGNEIPFFVYVCLHIYIYINPFTLCSSCKTEVCRLSVCSRRNKRKLSVCERINRTKGLNRLAHLWI